MTPGRPFRVLDIGCGDVPARGAIARRLKDTPLHYIGIDDLILPQPRLANPPQGYREDLIKATLSLHGEPRKLKRELLSLVGRQRFDEIHFHLPQPQSVTYRYPHRKTAGEVLHTLARFLKPGGRLYHTFQSLESPLVPEELPMFKGKQGPWIAFEHNERIFDRLAKSAGMRLDKYCFRPVERPASWGWYTQAGLKSQAALSSQPTYGKASRRYNELLDEYSHFPEYANHILIMRKPPAQRRQTQDR